MVEVTTYHVNVTRGDRYWLLHVPEIDHVTQARHLREVDDMARDLIALMTDTDPADVNLTVHIETPEIVREHLKRATELREAEANAKRAAADEMRAAARELREEGMPLRDVGEVLGVSYQRAHQLVS